jgi:hypothetical protein
MTHPPTRRGEVVQVDALRNLAGFERALVRELEDWPGATGHPLRVVHSLAGHLFGHYPTPRFLASLWFGGSTQVLERRRLWFIAHARGRSLRSLDLPIALTRRMEHCFLGTPDHLAFEPALRRAEVLGLGGTPELADAILATRLADRFDDGARWRAAISWLVGCGDAVELAQVGPVVDYLAAHLHAISLRGRTFASVLRLVDQWHAQLRRTRRRVLVWPRSGPRELFEIEPARGDGPPVEWTIVELLDSVALLREGRAMRHCVASYDRACVTRTTAIWSLRRRRLGGEGEDRPRSILTIEVRPATGTIVQVRGPANSPPAGWPLELVLRWALREGLRFHPTAAPAAGPAWP